MDVDRVGAVGNVVLDNGDVLFGTGLLLDNVEGGLLEVVVLRSVVVLEVELLVLSDEREEVVVDGIVEELVAATYPDVTSKLAEAVVQG